MKFRQDFIGTGNMERFCEESNKLFAALNNIVFLMPSGYEGVEPSIRIEEGRIIFDFGQAQIFTLNNVNWVSGSGDVYISNGQLNIDPD